MFAECDPRNECSWRLLDKAGLDREAHFRKNVFFQRDASGKPKWKDTYVYAKCYCNIPKKVDTMNKQYCECSAGWYERLFSEVFEKDVEVQIIDTIINGANECTFEISGF